MSYGCQLGQLVPRAQLVRYVPMNSCQLGQLVSSAQMARYVLFLPIGPNCSTGPIGAISPNELMPFGPIGSIGPIGAVDPIVANWANLFYGPNWRDMYYVCPCMPIGPIGSTGPFGAVCTNELMPIGPFGSIGPIGAICNIYANWANWFHGPNWCDMSQ